MHSLISIQYLLRGKSLYTLEKGLPMRNFNERRSHSTSLPVRCCVQRGFHAGTAPLGSSLQLPANSVLFGTRWISFVPDADTIARADSLRILGDTRSPGYDTAGKTCAAVIFLLGLRRVLRTHNQGPTNNVPDFHNVIGPPEHAAPTFINIDFTEASISLGPFAICSTWLRVINTTFHSHLKGPLVRECVADVFAPVEGHR